MFVVGATLEFTDCVIAITGKVSATKWRTIDRYRAIEVKPRDVLSCGSFEIGMFGYIAFWWFRFTVKLWVAVLLL